MNTPDLLTEISLYWGELKDTSTEESEPQMNTELTPDILALIGSGALSIEGCSCDGRTIAVSISPTRKGLAMALKTLSKERY